MPHVSVTCSLAFWPSSFLLADAFPFVLISSDWHLSSGLAAIFVTGVPEAQKTLTIPQFMHDQCAKANIPSSGNVVGTFSTTDFAGETLGPFPIVAGWTAKARGALAGCILSALCGMIAVVWYSWGALDDSEIEEEEQRRHEQKLRDQ